MVDDVLLEAVAAARQRRAQVAGRLHDLTPDLVAASHAMADRLGRGATLHPVGRGVSAIDAAHVTVEFIHPVIVGKRALPSLTLAPDRLDLVRPGSVVLGLDLGDRSSAAEVLAWVDDSCLTVALTAHDLPGSVDHVLAMGTSDPFLARELEVSCYHLLWEVVHEFLDGASSTAEQAPDGLGDLYPFLYERADDAGDAVAAHAEASTRAKASEIGELRDEVLQDAAGTLADLAGTLRAATDAGGTVWTFGNGGSSTDAQAVAHLLGDQALPGRTVAARSLTDDVATLTALANDVSFDVTFARTLRSLGRPGDVAVGLSTSGCSTNVLAGLEAAHELGLTTVGFAGYEGGDMAQLDTLDHLLVVPSSSVHRIQEAQTTLAHVLIELARAGT